MQEEDPIRASEDPGSERSRVLISDDLRKESAEKGHAPAQTAGSGVRLIDLYSVIAQAVPPIFLAAAAVHAALSAAALSGSVQWSFEGPEQKETQRLIDAVQKAVDTAAKLGIDPTTLPTSLPNTSLVQQWIADRVPVDQIREIEALAEQVFGDREAGAKWLSEPYLATDEKAPITLLGDQHGYERVKNLLLRIEYGVLA
jgi:hypothetical protein